MQVRVARPTRDLDRACAFYRDAVGLSVLSSFADHDGYSGVILGVPDATHQLELVLHADVEPSPTAEDQLVLYLGSEAAVAGRAAAIEAAGHEPRLPPNPYWTREGASAFVDPDGYWLILSPDRWE
ncbi:MAG TPA: VOC family protein [Gaiellaceae bacterium]|nr:VOC family protein [Gaiellaceae bacterium]